MLRAKATMVVMSEVWMVRWVGCFRWCLPMCEWWKGLPVAWTSTVKVCVDCCCCQWRTREWTASMSRCWGTELKKPTRSSLVACSEMSGGVWVR